jgi:hypothetical protein
MKRLRLKNDESGFIPLLLSILFVVLAGIVMVYLRVMHANG